MVVMSLTACVNPRGARICGTVTTLIFLTTLFYTYFHYDQYRLQRRSETELAQSKPGASEIKHLLLPANHRDINLCKTLLGLAVLGYPAPSLLSWNQATAFPNSLDNGAQVYSKIVRTMDYFNSIPRNRDHELALVADGFDVWFQLRPDVLISRYHEINKEANERHQKLFSPKAIDAMKIDQRVLFAASKKCSNQLHSRACFAVPEAPTPMAYGDNTDTMLGRSLHSAFRPRFLGDGFIMGPVGTLRNIFIRAQAVAEALPEIDEDKDNGSRESDFIYHGHVTSVFAMLFGDQEHKREEVRRRYSDPTTLLSRMLGKRKSCSSTLNGMFIEDKLDPPFTHEDPPASKWKTNQDEEFEFGIGLDYDARIMMNTQDSYYDGFFLKHNMSDPFSVGEVKNNVLLQHQQMPEAQESREKNPVWKELKEQIFLGSGSHKRTQFDCKGDLEDFPLASDLTRSPSPFAGTPQSVVTRDGGETPREAPTTLGWGEVSLYTNICYKTVPAMIHHDGDKSMRSHAWEQIWWQSWADSLLENAQRIKKEEPPAAWPGGPGTIRSAEIGAWSDKGTFMRWGTVCPRDYRYELFRNME
ncbi:MAG: hypothetical protein M1828_002193 [Chrysothrix sp. TS-e1954]|nr:MAG: hypothetical protein M1828_002193 [Chrysothrix sp. TS-e1954]